MAQVIKTKIGQEIIVDDDIYEKYKNYPWHVSSRYAHNDMLGYMHKLIQPQITGQITDHINNNPLDNRRENLRLVGKAANRHNSKLNSDNKSGFKGVHYREGYGYRAMITINGKKVYLGYFKTPEEASVAYKQKAKEFYGTN